MATKWLGRLQAGLCGDIRRSGAKADTDRVSILEYCHHRQPPGCNLTGCPPPEMATKQHLILDKPDIGRLRNHIREYKGRAAGLCQSSPGLVF
jgi:hypothetical protein